MTRAAPVRSRRMTDVSPVVLNALFLAPGVTGGPETYLRGLAPALAEQFPALELHVVTTGSGAGALRKDGWEEFAKLVALPCEDGQRVRRQWAEQVLLPVLARRARAGLVHSLASVAPLRPGVRSVVTIHDVTFLLHRTFGAVTTFGMSRLVRSAARRADALIAVSAAARDEICSVLGVPATRFAVIHHGHELPHVAPLREAEVRERHRLDGRRVVLCVAAKRPHKNQELLVRASSALGADTAIVLAGHAESYEAHLRALAHELGVEERVRFVGFVSGAELEGLWAVADCAAFPTLAEGFGLPVLEALARGVPVAASDLAVLHEVGGELPHWFDPHDQADAARAILAAMADEATARRGPAHVAAFTWAAAARATYSVYEGALRL
jgi:glycosyltransferase involved in cell wall biosynthesis